MMRQHSAVGIREINNVLPLEVSIQPSPTLCQILNKGILLQSMNNRGEEVAKNQLNKKYENNFP
jgi:hypothetical protein